MNLLKTLFSAEMEEPGYFDSPYPLTNNFFNGDEGIWQDQADALAVVMSVVHPGHLGRVKFHGVRWRACCDRPLSLAEGTQVRVLGRRANILVVEPVGASVLR